jgi:hypothetical protein
MCFTCPTKALIPAVRQIQRKRKPRERPIPTRLDLGPSFRIFHPFARELPKQARSHSRDHDSQRSWTAMRPPLCSRRSGRMALFLGPDARMSAPFVRVQVNHFSQRNREPAGQKLGEIGKCSGKVGYCCNATRATRPDPSAKNQFLAATGRLRTSVTSTEASDGSHRVEQGHRRVPPESCLRRFGVRGRGRRDHAVSMVKAKAQAHPSLGPVGDRQDLARTRIIPPRTALIGVMDRGQPCFARTG